MEFRSGVGILLHLVKYTRPESRNCTRELSRVMNVLNKAHLKELYQVIKFILDTEDWKLLIDLDNNRGGIFYLTGKSDSDFAGHKKDCRSITG